MRNLFQAALCALATMVVGCNGDNEPADRHLADSASHWLLSCEADSECGDATCMCGICTEVCTSDALCGDGAVCAPEAIACGGAGPSVCAEACSENADCGEGLACVAGACVNTAAAHDGADAGADADASADAGDGDGRAEDVADATLPDGHDAAADANPADTELDAELDDTADTERDAEADSTLDADTGTDGDASEDAADASEDAADASEDTADASEDATDGGGDAGGGELPELVCLDGEPVWEFVTLPPTGSLNAWAFDVDAHGGPVHVLVGEDTTEFILGPRSYRVLRWNGAGWDDLGEPDVAALEAETLGNAGVVWEAIAVGPEGEVWIGGDAELGPLGPGRGYQLPVAAEWRDGAWSDAVAIDLATVEVEPFPPRGGSIFDMDVLADGSVYAVGQSSGWGGLTENNGSLPMVLRNDGAGWVERNVTGRDWPGVRGSTYARSVVSPDGASILAVGRHPGGGVGGEGAIVLVDDPTNGPTFVVTPGAGSEPTGTAARNVAARSASDIWVVGDGTSVTGGFLMHFDGASWTLAESGLPVEETLSAITLAGGDVGWAFPLRSRTYVAETTEYTTHDAMRHDGETWTRFDLDAALGESAGVGIYDSVLDGDGAVWVAGYAYGAASTNPPVPMVAAWRCPGAPTD